MGRSAARMQPPESAAPAIRSPKTIAPKRPRRLHRRINNPPLPGRKQRGTAAPPHRWKLHDAERLVKPPEQAGPCRRSRCGDESSVRGPTAALSARKLAAVSWHLQLAQVGGGGREASSARLGFESTPRHLHFPNICNHDRTGLPTSISKKLTRHISPGNSKASLHKLEACALFSIFAMEKATKWDAGCLKSGDEIYHNYGHQKLHKDWLKTASVISVLHTEIEQARCRIIELKSERQSAKDKLNHFLRKLAEEKASWKIGEHKKIRNIITVIKDDINRERKSRKRMEIMHSKLVNELAEAKLSAKQYLQDYEKERKARELMEDVCNELAKEIADDKAEVESLKSESTKVREELDEERKMLQMAEVWREERVQMKLVDGKLMLEEKYAELVKLQADLDAFLRMHANTNGNVLVLKEVEVLQKAASSTNFQDIEFHYQPPPASGDILSAFVELQPREEANERVIEQCFGCSPGSHASKIHAVSPETDIFLKSSMKVYANGMFDRDENIQDSSSLETVSQREVHGYCDYPEGNDPSANGIHEESQASINGTGLDVKGDHSNLNSEISEVCSRNTKQSRKKVPSIGKFWKSSCTSKSNDKKTSVGSNGKLLNGGLRNPTLSTDMNSGEVGPGSPSVGQQSSCDSMNSHFSRGTKGCVEWPRDTKNHSLKTKLLEARMENQKIQLRHVLKHKS